MIRYGATSAICIVITQVLLLIFLHGAGMSAVPANLAATVLTAVPAFILNKYWVWGRRGRAHLRREVLPFWAFTVAGWILSTGSVAIVEDRVGTPETAAQTIAVMLANIAGFGILWILKYLFLDKVMFGPGNHTPYDEPFERATAELAALDAEAADGSTRAGT